jgi:hypothetical protein
MKRALAAVLTISILGVLFWQSLRRQDALSASSASSQVSASVLSEPQPFREAEQQVRALVASARAGDVAAYLASFADPMRQKLERDIAERGREAFAADLRFASETRKSHAVFAPEAEGTDAARITVESVYADRNERQTYHLAKTPSGWRVVDVETARSLIPIAKFGAPAEYQEPEGMPVQGAPDPPNATVKESPATNP